MQEYKNNAGVTLLELIVVIAILAVITGGVIASVGLGKWASTSGCANRIDSRMEQVKTLSMSKSDAGYLALYKKEDGYYVSTVKKAGEWKEDTDKEEKVGGTQMSIEVTFADGTTKNMADSTLYLSFDRASGALLDAQAADYEGAPYPVALPEQITVTAKGRKSTIKVVAQTGKHYID